MMAIVPKFDPANVYYPSRAKTGELHDDFRIAYDHIYEMRQQLADAHSRMTEMAEQLKKLQTVDHPQGPSNSKLSGLHVRNLPTADGQQLTYVAARGDLEWQ